MKNENIQKMSFDQIVSDQRARVLLGEKNIDFFANYYLAKYFLHRSPKFHTNFFNDLRFEKIKNVLWIAFRESAKTALGKFKIIHACCYGYKKNIGWAGNDKVKAKKNIRSIANELQANKLIIQDFGQLFWDYQPRKKTKSKAKQIDEFVTENGTAVRALSTNISTRGDVNDEFRPDLYVIDDIENQDTKNSVTKTKGVIDFLDELLTGRSVDCDILFLGNRISEHGSIAFLEKKAKANHEKWKMRDVPLIKNGKITWRAKFVFTENQAFTKNSKIKNKKKHVRSIEDMKKEFGSAGFDQEFLNKPKKEGGQIINKKWFKRYDVNRLIKDKDNNFWYRFDNDDAQIKGTVYTAIDPAISTKETSDERAILSGARFQRVIKLREDNIERTIKENYYFIFKCVAGRWSLKDFAQKLAKQRDLYRPQKIGCESNGVQQVFRESFQMFGISTIALNPDADKVRRLARHAGDVEFGYVLFPNDGSCQDLEDELDTFSGDGKNPDNRVDAFSYFLQMAKEKSNGFILQQIN